VIVIVGAGHHTTCSIRLHCASKRTVFYPASAWIHISSSFRTAPKQFSPCPNLLYAATTQGPLLPRVPGIYSSLRAYNLGLRDVLSR
jgi:hypothetical protein